MLGEDLNINMLHSTSKQIKLSTLVTNISFTVPMGPKSDTSVLIVVFTSNVPQDNVRAATISVSINHLFPIYLTVQKLKGMGIKPFHALLFTI